MFYNEDEIQGAVDLAEKILGPQNQYRSWSEGHLLLNVAIVTGEYGKIWYGDMVLDQPPYAVSAELDNKLNLLSDTLGQRVYLIEEDMFENPLFVSTNSLPEDYS